MDDKDSTLQEIVYQLRQNHRLSGIITVLESLGQPSATVNVHQYAVRDDADQLLARRKCRAQVKENRGEAIRLAALVSGILIALKEHHSSRPDADFRVRLFLIHTLPDIQALIDECCENVAWRRVNNAQHRMDKLRLAEDRLRNFVEYLGLSLIGPCTAVLLIDALDYDQRYSHSSQEQFRQDVEAELMNKPCDSSTVWNMVESAKTKFFTTKSTSKTIKRDEVDLVFLIDATGGMAENGTFDKVKDLIPEIVKKTESSLMIGLSLLRVGLVAYRDVWEDGTAHLETEILTHKKGPVLRHVQRLVASGGMDTAEDVLGGLEEVSKNMLWNSRDNRILVHITDSPSHGKDFHELGRVHDALYDSVDTKKRMKKALQDIKKKGVKYFFVKISPCTDRMIEEFHTLVGKQDFPTQIDISDVNLSAMIVGSMVLGPARVTPSIAADNETPAVDLRGDEPGQTEDVPLQEGVLARVGDREGGQDVRALPSRHPNIVHAAQRSTATSGALGGGTSSLSPTSPCPPIAAVDSSRNGNSTPASTLSLGGRAPSHGGNLPASPPTYEESQNKLSSSWEAIARNATIQYTTFRHTVDPQTFEVTKEQTNELTKVITENGSMGGGQRWKYVKRALLNDHPAYPCPSDRIVLKEAGMGESADAGAKNNALASVIAKMFNEAPDRPSTCPRVEYVKCCLLESMVGHSQYCMETYLGGSEYTAFTTWSSSTDVAAAGSQEALEAFMHFSRKFTDERFMVINLKGVRRKNDQAYVLTDPIVTTPYYDVFNEFSARHECKEICKSLGLHKPVHAPVAPKTPSSARSQPGQEVAPWTQPSASPQVNEKREKKLLFKKLKLIGK